ncbi:MAG: hypothetical protein J3Q66DRAFT_342427 [Benniella sp.]|nr:MAG: hypothetical protein J3Q66DRAFT_342427 [Benniella sp.]
MMRTGRTSPRFITSALSWTLILTLTLLVCLPVDSVPISPLPNHHSITPRAELDTPTRGKKQTKTPGEQGVQKPQYDIEILNPAPHDVWSSGTIKTLSWKAIDLPPTATFDISIVPVDPEINPEASELTRRPILRYISVQRLYQDIVVPYDLITQEQLRKEQEDGATLLGWFHDNTTETDTTTSSQEPSPQDVRSMVRVYFTVYEGRTNKVLARKSIFPVEIRKDRARDLRTVLPPPPFLEPAQQPSQQSLDKLPESTMDLQDIMEPESDLLEGDMLDAAFKGDGDGNDGDLFNPIVNVEIELKPENGVIPRAPETGAETKGVIEESTIIYEHHLDKSEEDRSHIIDRVQLQEELDIKNQEELLEQPNHNPPVKVIDSGTIQITRWIENKVRLFAGAPYVFGWEFPESERNRTGQVSVFIEDAYTGKRYDIAAGPMPSSVQFMYLMPRAILMSVDPRKRTYLRARVELDLYDKDTIHRYTGFSKVFWVQRGAL